MRLRLFLAITGLVVLALVATAAVRLSGFGGTSEPEPAAADDAALPPGPVATYVALGDSYTAGPLIRWMRSDPPTCLRSTRNYPAVLAQWLEVEDLVDVSCSGADTGNITASQSWFGRRAPAQLSAVTADSDLVTLGVGGNDADLFSSLVAGARPPGLPMRSPAASSGSPRHCSVGDQSRPRAIRRSSRRSTSPTTSACTGWGRASARSTAASPATTCGPARGSRTPPPASTSRSRSG